MVDDDDPARHQPPAGAPGGYMRRVGDTEPRVLGFAYAPLVDGATRHWRRMLHPVRWVRWRVEVRRLGPYAPDFDAPDHRDGPLRRLRKGRR